MKINMSWMSYFYRWVKSRLWWNVNQGNSDETLKNMYA